MCAVKKKLKNNWRCYDIYKKICVILEVLKLSGDKKREKKLKQNYNGRSLKRNWLIPKYLHILGIDQDPLTICIFKKCYQQFSADIL